MPVVEMRWVRIMAMLVGVALGVDAHGYVSRPASRSYNCKTGAAKNCGDVQYEPQSVEATKGLPFHRAASSSNALCSGGVSRFSQLDRTSPSWPTASAEGVTAFTWVFTAFHASESFTYYITKPAWDSSTGLDAADLDPEPFLTVPMNGKPPAATETHSLPNGATLPSRTGHHIVYAVWTISDTNNAFYQCIDLHFPSTTNKVTNATHNNTCARKRTH